MTRGNILVAILVAGIAVGGASASAFAAAEEDAPWRETTRDVYLDGRLEPGAIVLREAESGRLAVLRGRSDTSPLVVDPESLGLSRLALDTLAFGESGWEGRATAGPDAAAKGSATRIDDSTLLLRSPDGYVIVTDHAGTFGPVSRERTFGIVPSWKELYDRYQPDDEVVRALSAVDEDLQLTLAMGTWCGDSKRETPRLLKTLDLAANPRIQLQVVALSRGFDEPAELIKSRALTNVPTLIVSRGDEELGRVVETPAGDTLAADLVRILERAPLVNEGRWSRKERLARGRYSVRDASGAERGVEDWELFADDDDGTLLHAWSDNGSGTTEVWHRRDGDGHTSFVEVTTTEGPWHRRTRQWIEDGVLSAVTRGNGTGVIRQDARLDEGTLIVAPSVADLGIAALRAAVSQGPTARPALLLGGSGESPTGRLAMLELGHRGADSTTTDAGTFETTRVSGRVGGRFSDGWLHADLGVAIRWRYANGDEARLTTLETPAEEDDAAR